MRRKISTLDVRQRLGEILNCVALRHDQYIIERKGRPLAALVPIEKLEQIEAAARAHFLDLLSRAPQDLSVEEADRIADEAKHKGRATRHRTRR